MIPQLLDDYGLLVFALIAVAAALLTVAILIMLRFRK